MALPIDVGRLGLGCASLGNLYSPVRDDEALAVVDAAWDLGVRLFDTAPLYGHGLSETRLGLALRRRPRDEYVLATKVGRLLVDDGPAGPPAPSIFADAPPRHPVFDFSHDGVLRSIDASLERLGLDRIDLLHVHDPDDHLDEALSAAFPTLERLKAQGVVHAIGLGTNTPSVAMAVLDRVELDWLLLAGRCTLLDRSGAEEVLPRCAAAGVDVLAAGVFNSGLLANPVPGATYDYAPASPEVLARAEEIAAVCERHGIPVAAAALQWPLRHPGVTTVLIGPRDEHEMREDHALLELSIPAELWDELEGLSCS